MSDPLSFLEQVSGDGLSAIEKARIASARDDAREQREAERAEAERQAAAEQRLMSTGLAEKQLGHPLAELSRAQMAVGPLADRVAELRHELGRAERRLERAEGSVKFWATRAGDVHEAVQRSAPGLAELPASRAHREFVNETRRMLAESRAARPERRPFARPGGVAVRSEQVTCEACAAVGASPEESFLIHHSDADGRPLSVPQAERVPVPPDDSERSAAGYGGVIYR
jgi:hypothetical protein